MCARVSVYLCMQELYALVFCACLCERARIVRMVVGGKRLTFPHSGCILGMLGGRKSCVHAEGRRTAERGAIKGV